MVKMVPAMVSEQHPHSYAKAARTNKGITSKLSLFWIINMRVMWQDGAVPNFNVDKTTTRVTDNIKSIQFLET